MRSSRVSMENSARKKGVRPSELYAGPNPPARENILPLPPALQQFPFVTDTVSLRPSPGSPELQESFCLCRSKIILYRALLL